MLKQWHNEDIEQALIRQGWSGLREQHPDSYHVGHVWEMTREGKILRVSLEADFGTGHTGDASIESVSARNPANGQKAELWLSRTRSAKWKRELLEWAEALSRRDKRKPQPAAGATGGPSAQP